MSKSREELPGIAQICDNCRVFVVILGSYSLIFCQLVVSLRDAFVYALFHVFWLHISPDIALFQVSMHYSRSSLNWYPRNLDYLPENGFN